MGPSRSAAAASRTRSSQEGRPWLPHTVVGIRGNPATIVSPLAEGQLVLLAWIRGHALHDDLASDQILQTIEPAPLLGFQMMRHLGVDADEHFLARGLARGRLHLATDFRGVGEVRLHGAAALAGGTDRGEERL